jgi:uncharacterized protein (DUF983 family)
MEGTLMSDKPSRNLGAALWNGLRCRCPRCGMGKLYRRYLKVADRCEVCGLDFSHHRADDLPPYIAITIVGHILVAFLLHYELSGAPLAPWVYLAWLVPAAVILPLIMLPSIKGAVIAFQWARGMHGFDDT